MLASSGNGIGKNSIASYVRKRRNREVATGHRRNVSSLRLERIECSLHLLSPLRQKCDRLDVTQQVTCETARVQIGNGTLHPPCAQIDFHRGDWTAHEPII